jgi:hypothetical protein
MKLNEFELMLIVHNEVLIMLLHDVLAVTPKRKSDLSIVTPSTSSQGPSSSSVLTPCPRCHVDIAPDDVDNHHHQYHDRLYDIAPPNYRKLIVQSKWC